MLRTDQGIILHYLRHTDSTFILHFFGQKTGYKTGLYRKPAKKALSLLHPLSLLEITFVDRENRDLNLVRELSRLEILEGIQTDVRKSSVALFLSEVLYRSLEKGYVNPGLFDFCAKSVMRFNHLDFQPNFHIWFLIKLTQFYGLSPRLIEGEPSAYFSVETGEIGALSRFRHSPAQDQEMGPLIARLLELPFESAMSLGLSAQMRRNLLDLLLRYMMYHMPGFKKLNSRDVLEMVFS